MNPSHYDRRQVMGISENRDRKLSLECVTMNSPCKGKSLQTTVYWVDQYELRMRSEIINLVRRAFP